MSIVYYISGTSRGIGKALVNAVLSGPHASSTLRVYGIARGDQNVSDPRFHAIKADLSDASVLQLFSFDAHDDARTIVVVHNAGMLEPIGRLGTLDNALLQRSINLGTLAPATLANNFLRAYGGGEQRLIFINISSGAAQRPLDTWGGYCTGKAGAEMLCRVGAEEANVTKTSDRVYFFSVAPGVVDTQMQAEIRERGPQVGFSGIQRFVELYREKQLVSPDYVAEKLMEIVMEPQNFETVHRIPPPS